MVSRIRDYFKKDNWQWYTLFSVLVGIWCLITLILFADILVSSFKANVDIFRSPWGIPGKLIVKNYVQLIKDGFFTYYLNSFIVLVVSIIFLLLLASLAAYGLGKFQFKGNKALLSYFLLGMMFPVQLGILPLFNLMKGLHLINNLWCLILINVAALSVPVFVLTNFAQTIPDSMREAAKIDGASEFAIYRRIFMPLMRPALAVLIPLSAVGIWNDFFIPLVFISVDSMKTVPLGLMLYFTGKGFDLSKTGIVFAAMALSIFPLLFLYLFGAKNIIQGLTQGAVKS
jgi:raffinose/stachyose/melibiose transport system permease protein